MGTFAVFYWAGVPSVLTLFITQLLYDATLLVAESWGCKMAFHKHLKLPPYRLTKRCGREVQVRSIHRSCPSSLEHCLPSATEEVYTGDSGGSALPFLESDTESHSFPEPTLHELQSKASIAGWKKLRKQMILTAVERSAMPVDQLCFLCGEIAVFRCQECGPLAYFCYKCLCAQHEKANFFHVPEKWEVRLVFLIHIFSYG